MTATTSKHIDRKQKDNFRKLTKEQINEIKTQTEKEARIS
jgi:hypothetical protein